MAAEGGTAGTTALLWFKQDLRTDDHPGLIAAAARHRSVVPVYVFDPRILRGYSDDMLEVLLTALRELKKSLGDQGSDLLIGFGNSENVILKLANEAKASHVFAEEELEYRLCEVVSAVEASALALTSSSEAPRFEFWQTPFYDIENLTKLPVSYNDFEKKKFDVTTPLAPPTLPLLPSLQLELGQGSLPTFDDLKKYISENTSETHERWASVKSLSADDILTKRQAKQAGIPTDTGDFQKSNGSGNPVASNGSLKTREKATVFTPRKGTVVAGGTDVVLNALAAYLRYLEGTARDDWQELHDKLRISERRRGTSFSALFGCALSLGVLSRRRVFFETIKYEKERNAGFLSPFGYSIFTVAAAVEAVKSMEWYALLSLKTLKFNQARYPVRIWKWRQHLIQYTVSGCEGPAVLLVHGFGAFLDHYRDNIIPLADNGHRVWAITLLGFGKSEKPNIEYTELVWAELLRDFIIDVVGEPVHLVGNSIGGYFSTAVAGLWPGIAKSLILINTAGSIDPGYSSVQLIEREETSTVAWLGARLLLLYLQLRVRQLATECYPSHPERVDDWLVNEMLRASYDPGAIVILESVFNFNLSVPLNYLFNLFGGKILVIQGTKDPLSKSKPRLSMIKEHCIGVSIKELDAGHCPHDEKPELVNSIVSEWVASVESSFNPVGSV